MRGLIISLCMLLLAGCGAGGGSSNNVPPPVPTSAVNGAAVDGLIMNGTIRIYDFSTGSKGALLAETTTDNDGLYDVELQAESRPILIELTEGSYREEATGSTVALTNDEAITALENHVAGENVTISVTAFTHIAAGLAHYLMTTGVSVEESINTANHRITQWIGLPITETIPLDITKSSSLSASLTPAHFYGFLSGAISYWTREHYPNSTEVTANGCAQYDVCSIDFIQSMYADIHADGLLDGLGAGGIPLSFGGTSLGVSVYRTELALAILDVSDFVPNGDYGNKTGLTSTQLLVRSRAYAANTDPLFAAVPPVSIDTPAISLDSHSNGEWVRATINVTGTVVDQIGPGIVTFAVDGVVMGSVSADYFTPSITWNTSMFLDGTHTITLNVTNGAGLTASASADVMVDNTKPTTNFTSVPEGDKCRITGGIYDMPGLSIGGVTVTENTYSSMSYSRVIYYGSNNTTHADYAAKVNSFRASIPMTMAVVESASTTRSVINNFVSILVNPGPQRISVKDEAGNETLVTTGGNDGIVTNNLICTYMACTPSSQYYVHPEAYNVMMYGPKPTCSAPVVIQ